MSPEQGLASKLLIFPNIKDFWKSPLTKWLYRSDTLWSLGWSPVLLLGQGLGNLVISSISSWISFQSSPLKAWKEETQDMRQWGEGKI